MTECCYCNKYFNEKYIVKGCDCGQQRGCVNCIYKDKHAICRKCKTRSSLRENGVARVLFTRLLSVSSAGCWCGVVSFGVVTSLWILAHIFNILAIYIVTRNKKNLFHIDHTASEGWSMVWLGFVHLFFNVPVFMQFLDVTVRRDNDICEKLFDVNCVVFTIEGFIVQVMCAHHLAKYYNTSSLLFIANVTYAIMYAIPMLAKCIRKCISSIPRPNLAVTIHPPPQPLFEVVHHI